MRNIFIVLLLVVISACQTDELNNPEDEAVRKAAKNPVQELAWLKALVHPTTEHVCSVQTVQQGTYLSQPVYLISVSGALCCTCAGRAVYNQRGELVLVCNVAEEAKIAQVKVVWQRQ